MLTDGIYLSSLGGSGENGRNCHLIGTNDGYILLDCGVKREICGDIVGFYPELTSEIISGIKAVFLSHCHEDHVAALPLLYELGYKGKVYATAETLAEVPGFIKKWMSYVEAHGGQLPFGKESVQQICYDRIGLGEQDVCGIHLTTGRSGHVLGGIWYMFSLAGRNILYTGDMCLTPASLMIDLPDLCDGAIMNCAYAGKTTVQEKQYAALLKSVLQTVEAGGKVLLPVPSKGRGTDMLMYLEKNLADVRLYSEQAIADSCIKLMEKKDWIKPGIEGKAYPGAIIIHTAEERRAALEAEGGAVYLTPDGMLTTPVGLEYYESLKGSASNKIIITGHAAAGTVGYGVLDEEYRKQHGIEAAGEKIVFKVHLDDNDVIFLADRIKARSIILFHSGRECTANVVQQLQERNVKAVTITYPERLEL